ncbi:MOSC domain-containing protein [Niallia sp. 03133]|uniref:MOSC domain-containing protein n=1 Tax=Niallia sp. 03133 TaxID=3458060 RepID=UPI004045086E
MSEIITLSIGKPASHQWKEKTYTSAIGKSNKEEVLLTFDGFVGDEVANPTFHGGPERAVCFYPFEHYDQWEQEFGVKLSPPAFGENICTSGFLEKNTYIGDIFSLGNAVVQVTQGRIPCSIISKFNHVDSFLNRIVETCFTGYFLKVLEEGVVTADSSFTLMERKQQDISVWDATKLMLLDRENKEQIKKVMLLDALAVDWKNRFEKALQKK